LDPVVIKDNLVQSSSALVACMLRCHQFTLSMVTKKKLICRLFLILHFRTVSLPSMSFFVEVISLAIILSVSLRLLMSSEKHTARHVRRTRAAV